MQVLETRTDVEFIFSELREEMAAAHVRAVKRLVALGITVNGRVTDELEAEAKDLREWVDRVRAAVDVGSARQPPSAGPNRYTPENSPDRP